MKKIYPLRNVHGIISCAILTFSIFFSSPVNAECEQASAYFDQAITYKNGNHFKQALNNFQQAAQLCPNYLVFYEQGQTLIKLKRFDDALDSFKTARNYSEKNSKSEAKALARMALIFTQQKSLQKASIIIEEAYKINKENSPKWILRLRKAIGLQSANHIASAIEINQAITDVKSFGVRPKISFNSITFKFDSTEFTAEGQQQVIELGKALANTKQQALLIGHTDKRGDEAYNLSLSKRRADAVKRALIDNNPMLTSSLQTQGKGEEEIRYLGNDETDHQLNRRVEMQLL